MIIKKFSFGDIGRHKNIGIFSESLENKGENAILCPNGNTKQPRVLARDTYELSDAYLSRCNKATYKYDVELIMLNDLIGKNSVVNTLDFKNFVEKELEKEKNKVYDQEFNIRDLYPIEIHFEQKQKEDIERFELLNKMILSNSKRINRRVTKKEIVYKKDKAKSILSFIITKSEGIKMFAFNYIEEFDLESRFITISKKNCKPLEKCMKIKNDNDLEYIKMIIDKYLKKAL